MNPIIYIKKLPFVDHVVLKPYINRDDILNRNMVSYLLMNGIEPLQDRFKTGVSIFKNYHRIPPHLIINKEDLSDLKTCPNTGYITFFSNPIKFTSWPNKELEQRLEERRARKATPHTGKPFEGIPVWDKEKKREYLNNKSHDRT